jgi:hypothetical protein
VEKGKSKMVKQSSSGLIYQLHVQRDFQSINSLTLGVKNFQSDAQEHALKIQKGAQLIINKELLPKLNQQLKKLEPNDRKRLNDALNTQQQENTEAQIELAPYNTTHVLLEDI